VEILLSDQPILAATQRRAFQRQIAMRMPRSVRQRVRRNPLSITAAERELARESEKRYEAAVAQLDDEAAETSIAQRDLQRAIHALGGRVIETRLVLSSIIARAPAAALGKLAAREDVQAIERSPRDRPLLDIGSPLVGASTWWGANHTGGRGSADTLPADVGLAGEAADPAHPAFGLIVVENSPMVSPDDHGTHVGGVVASGNATFRGVAPGPDRLMGAIADEWLLGLPSFEGPGAADPIETMNLSAGSPANDDDASDYGDALVAHFGVGFAGAAGNDGPDVTVNEIGRNTLSVGAFSDLNTASPADDVMTTFSSRGPSPGGRKKPDLIAPGAGITSTNDDWEGAGADFTSDSGTSFSTPFVAGAMALLEGAGITDPKAQRALLVNTARDWMGQTHWMPDSGWGALDLSAALAQRANLETGSVQAASARFYRATSVPNGAKATLAWNMSVTWDNAPSCCYTTFATTNLDLRQYLASSLNEVPPPSDPGNGAGPDAVDPNDTTEQVRAPGGGPQGVIYKVDAASSIAGASSEAFAIAAAQPLTALVNPEVDPINPSTDAGGTVNCQTDVVVSTELENGSPDLDAGSAEVTLNLPSGLELVSGSATQPVSGGVLEASTTASETHTWTVRATSSGTKQLTITGSGETMDETFTSSDQVSFDADCSPPTVTPTGTTVSPPGPVACGTERVISTTLRNSTITDAASAQASLSFPTGADLVAGPAGQQVSGGVLEANTTSEAHSWTVRPAQPGLSATITGSGSNGTQTFSYPEVVSIDCQAQDGGDISGPAAVTLEIFRTKVKRGKLIVAGAASSAAGAPTGQVTIELEGDERKTKVAALRSGNFQIKKRICDPGRWRASAHYGGAPGFAAATSAPAVVRVRVRQIRCQTPD
jgi:serine protease AprX